MGRLALYFAMLSTVSFLANSAKLPFDLPNVPKSSRFQLRRLSKGDTNLVQNLYDEKYPEDKPVTIDDQIRADKFLDPECGSVYPVENYRTSFNLRMSKKEHGCSYTLRNTNDRNMNIVCAGLSGSTRGLDKAYCKGRDVSVQHSHTTTFFCGNQKMFSLSSAELKSEMQFINCAIILEDTVEEKKQGPVPQNNYQFVPQPCPRTCGISTYQPAGQQTRIIGGDDASVGEFPWQAFIYTLGYGEEGSLCGGSLVNSRYVLSAAHCFKQGQFMSVKYVAVVLGLHTITDLKLNPHTQLMRGIKVTVHPGFDISTMLNDISLVLLDEDVVWSTNISPICLSSPYENFDYQQSWVSGFGLVQFDEDSPDDNKLPEVLQKAELDIVPPGACRAAFSLFSVTIDSVGQVCTKGFGRDSCKGDSGGPIVVKNEAGRYEQVGIVSWGIGCNDDILPSVNTRVAAYRQWIVSTISDAKFATCS